MYKYNNISGQSGYAANYKNLIVCLLFLTILEDSKRGTNSHNSLTMKQVAKVIYYAKNNPAMSPSLTLLTSREL